MKYKSLVSVIIPSYSRPDGLRRAIDSVLNQTYPNIQIIVVDDNNPETEDRKLTEKVIREINSEKVLYLKHSENMNGSVARNTGIRKSTGKYIAFLDNDDMFLPEKINYQVNRLETLGEEYGICYTKFERRKNNEKIDVGIESREGNLTLEILKGNFYISAGSNLMVRRDIVEEINGFNEGFKRRQDLEFLIRASLITKIAHVDNFQLIINKDDQSNRLDLKGLKENSALYLDLFDEYLKKLSSIEKDLVLKSVHLNELRYYIYKIDFKGIIRISKEQKYNVRLLIRYFAYLVRRKVKKQCYGFKI